MRSARSCLGRLAVVALAMLTMASPPATAQQPWPTDGWSPSTPADEALDAAPLLDLVVRARHGDYGYVDRLFVVRNGKVVLDERFDNDYAAISDGHDMTPHQFNYQHPDDHPFWQGSEVHSEQSVTKSVTSLLVGIAIGRGEIESTEIYVLGFFEGRDFDHMDLRKRAIKLEHLLTMQSDIEWHEQDRPMGPANTTIQLEESDDWVQFTLDQPMDSVPGEKWTYNSGGSALLAAILLESTGEQIDKYAEEHRITTSSRWSTAGTSSSRNPRSSAHT